MPGRGWGVYQALDGTDIAVVNLQGRTYMQPIENPFTDADALLDESSEPLPPVRIVDFHCELTSEKNALGLHLDGRVSAVVGTHTHVVTGDERILPGGTAYQTDLGMTGPIWSVIGFDPKTVLPRFINALPDPVRGRRGAGDLQRRPDRHRPGDGPGARDRADPAPRRGLSVARTGRHAAKASALAAATEPGRSTVDLHTHTLRSDGVLQPVELVRAAAAAGVRTLAITDHDKLAAYRELVLGRAMPAPIELIPGVEINALGPRDPAPEGELHILGLRDGPGRRGVRGRAREAAGRPAHPVRADGRAAARDRARRSTPRSRPST